MTRQKECLEVRLVVYFVIAKSLSQHFVKCVLMSLVLGREIISTFIVSSAILRPTQDPKASNAGRHPKCEVAVLLLLFRLRERRFRSGK